MSNAKKDYHYYFLGPGSDYGEAMWSDLKNVDNLEYFNHVLGTDNKLLKFFHHLHFSFQINNIINLPFKNIWDRKFFKNLKNINNTEKACIIFTDISASRTSTSFLNDLSHRSNIKLVLINVNKYNKKKKILDERLKYFNHIFTFDHLDSEKYNFQYYPYCYSKQKLDFTGDNIDSKYDAFFVGNSKGRAKILNIIYKNLINNGGTAEFYINNVEKREKLENQIKYNEPIPYNKVLDKIARSNCLIEVLEDGQAGTTLRMMEAIVYTKKLLTNNINILNSQFYDPRYIQIFKDVEDINYNFIKEKISVNYNYNNEFSPIHFIEKLEKIL